MFTKIGGTLVYSTCTINPDENEEIVAWALLNFPCLCLCDTGQILVHAEISKSRIFLSFFPNSFDMLGEPGLKTKLYRISDTL
jgi:16S rRNA (cytosine1407-C5)-methyltransferase